MRKHTTKRRITFQRSFPIRSTPFLKGVANRQDATVPMPSFPGGLFYCKNFRILCQLPLTISNFSFTRLGGHQLIKVGVLGEHILKGNDAASHFDQTIAHLRCGDVIHLRLGDLQQLR